MTCSKIWRNALVICACVASALSLASCHRGPISGTLLSKRLEKPYESSHPVTTLAGYVPVTTIVHDYHPIGFAMAVIPEGKEGADATTVYALSQQEFDKYEIGGALILQEGEYDVERPRCSYSEYQDAQTAWAAMAPCSE